MLIRGWELSRLLNAEESGAGEGASGGGDVGGSPSPASESTSKSEYSVTDPGYDAGNVGEDEGDVLADLKAENAPNNETPADESADAGGDTEETAETQSGESAESDEDFSDGLLDRAVALGYTVADIKSFRSEKALAKEIDRVERLQQRVSSRQAPAQEQQPEAQAATIPEPDFTELDRLVEEGYLDERVANLQKQQQMQVWQLAVAAEQRAKQAESGLQQLAQAERQRASQQFFENFDSKVGSLGEEYSDLLGQGTIAEIRATSPEKAAHFARNRQKVMTEFADFRDRMLARGEALPTDDELIEKAVHSAFYKQTKSLARKELTNDIKRAGSQAVSRPRSTGRPALTGASAAAEKEANFWKKFSD